MNGLQIGLASLICASAAMMAAAEPIMTPGEEVALQAIKTDACTAPVLFIPLSEDVDIDQRIYAIVPATVDDPGSAHLVSAAERRWLIESGCEVQSNMLMAAKDTRQPALN